LDGYSEVLREHPGAMADMIYDLREASLELVRG
jgi:hypothetical protein